MTRFFITVALCFFCLTNNAQTTAAQYFEQMPDSLCQFLDAPLRKQLVENAQKNPKDSIKNLLNGKSVMRWVSDEYVVVQTSQVSNLQLRVLPKMDGDSILCLIRTVWAPEAESWWSFYDTSWKPLSGSFGLPELPKALSTKSGFDKILSQFTFRPDTLDEARFAELRKFIDPVMIRAEFAEVEPVLILSLSTPMLGKDDRREVEAILLQRKLNWNGEIFKEY